MGRSSTPRAQAWKRRFGDRLREVRTSRGLSQESLAHLAGVHRTYVGSVERGQQNVSLTNIHELAEALGIEVADLFRDG